jgi:hypothetical protein
MSMHRIGNPRTVDGAIACPVHRLRECLINHPPMTPAIFSPRPKVA